MDGEHTGDLSLMITDSGTRQCAWTSSTTRLSTAWHGTWATDSQTRLFVSFDYKGRAVDYKFAVVDILGRGADYRGRTIEMKLIATWTFDALTSRYVLGQ